MCAPAATSVVPIAPRPPHEQHPEGRARPPAAAAPAHRRLAPGWPLRAYFELLLVLVAAVAAASTVYVSLQTSHDAKRGALRDASFAARTSAGQLSANLALLRTTVTGLVASLQHEAIPRHLTAGCALTFSLGGGLASGHVDILRPDGVVVCSSRMRPGITRLPGYGGQDWLRRARRGDVFLAPVIDAATGAKVVLSAAPVGNRAVVAAFVELASLAPTLRTLYGGSRPAELIVTTGDGRTALSRSIDPRRWVGAPLSATPFGRGSGVERDDVDGLPRLYAEAGVPDAGWRLYVGENRAARLAAGHQLRNRQLAIILGGLLLVLLATLLIYRRVALPIARLREAVRASRPEQTLQPVPVAGPAEVTALATDINGLISAVEHELGERRRAEESARSSEQSYRLLFESSPLAMCVCELETLAIVEVNAAAVEQLGYDQEQFAARTVGDLVVPRERAALLEVLCDPKPSQQLGPLHLVRQNGSEIEVRLTSYTVPFGGRKARFLLIEDVGERERFERQLRQSQRLESLGQLAGGVAHDFNNLLGVIIGYASFSNELAASRAEAGDEAWSEARANIEQIEQAAQRAARLTHQLLAFARREVVKPTVLDLNEVVAELEPMLRRTLGEHVQLVVALSSDVWKIEIDKGQLEQVLVNLAVNARDAMPGGGQLTIDTDNVIVDADYAASRPGIATGNYVRLRVSDTGIGMDDTTLQRVFEPFFTTKPAGAGTGLGLATVYGILTQAGGRAQVYSEPGHGTTFTALLPATEAAVREAPPSEVDHLGGDGETILVVEDEAALRQVTARMLRRNGYRVLTAAHGPDAIELAARHRGAIDLLMSDVVMPHMLGSELAARMLELHPNIGLLYISGYAQAVLGSQGTLDPGVELLEKPFSEPQLLAKVRDVLNAAKRKPAARSTAAS